MNNIEEIRDYCLSKPATSEDMPFGPDTLVLKVAGKMFALSNLEGDLRINLKCNPEKAIELREEHHAIQPGFHMNKKHWNTVYIDGSLSAKFIMELIDHSYDMVVKSLPLKKRKEIKEIGLR